MSLIRKIIDWFDAKEVQKWSSRIAKERSGTDVRRVLIVMGNTDKYQTINEIIAGCFREYRDAPKNINEPLRTLLDDKLAQDNQQGGYALTHKGRYYVSHLGARQRMR